jgi:hypothetical protein
MAAEGVASFVPEHSDVNVVIGDARGKSLPNRDGSGPPRQPFRRRFLEARQTHKALGLLARELGTAAAGR